MSGKIPCEDLPHVVSTATMFGQKSHGSLISTMMRVSQYENIMRKFSESHRECKLSVDIPRVMRSTKTFPTGSKYEGTWDMLGMSGYGTYTFPDGVEYEGEFYDGTFHGKGDLYYPSGVILRCKWHKGQIMDKTLVFADGLEYSGEKLRYCRKPDRRFSIEHEDGLNPAGKSYLTAEPTMHEIPPGYYDTGDGFYDPKTKTVYKADDMSAIIRSPSEAEQIWIIQNCRTNPSKEIGPREDLYESWPDPMLALETLTAESFSKSSINRSRDYSRTFFDFEDYCSGAVRPTIASNTSRFIPVLTSKLDYGGLLE